MIRVLIAEDHLMVRAGIRALLEKAGDIHVMGEASNGQEAVEMTEALMRSILENKARCVIIDITGIEVMDTRTADHFIRMAKALRHLGTYCVLTGIKPVIAQTIVDMGIDMSDVATRRNLRDALQEYVSSGRSRARRSRSSDAALANGSTPARPER